MVTYSRFGRHGKVHGIEQDELLGQGGYSIVPRLVQWMVTARCDLACPHCLAVPDGQGELTTGEALHLIEQVGEIGVGELLLTGGEPLCRGDFCELVDGLRRHGVNWSLNTAVEPSVEQKRAIASWPPGFVAVSLDGPQRFHDKFRGRAGAYDEAMRSMAWFRELGVEVAAGTTVTALNYAYLPETFTRVVASGATSWGIHLVVPEGRAATRKGLELSASQLRGLIQLVAEKRRHFPVTVADEIGYCGTWEPLLRDGPFYCGAGRSGCVVLWDGEVVPCTTTDRSTSAGNVRTRPLLGIWQEGFSELRKLEPISKCRRCDYWLACSGGCWLQRRKGLHCFKEAWESSGTAQLLRRAAALAVGLHLGAAAGCSAAQERPAAQRTQAQPEQAATPGDAASPARHEVAGGQQLQQAVLDWYAAQLGGHRAPRREAVIARLRAALGADPVVDYMARFGTAEQRALDIVQLEEATKVVLATPHRSLSFLALVWRDLMEWSMDGTAPAKRTDAQSEALRRSVELLHRTAEAWRLEIFEKKLDSYLFQPLNQRHFMRSKAGPTPQQQLEANVASRQWQGGEDVTREFLAQHRFGERLDLQLSVSGDGDGVLIREGKGQALKGQFTMRAFDLIEWPSTKRMLQPHEQWEVLLSVQVAGRTLMARLPYPCLVSYGDVLRLFHEQNPEAFQGEGLSAIMRDAPSSPLLLPEYRRRMEAWNRANPQSSPDMDGVGTNYHELWRIIDIYLF